MTGESGLAVVMESGAGGRIYERSRDGAEVEIRFLATDPGLTQAGWASLLPHFQRAVTTAGGTR